MAMVYYLYLLCIDFVYCLFWDVIKLLRSFAVSVDRIRLLETSVYYGFHFLMYFVIGLIVICVRICVYC